MKSPTEKTILIKETIWDCGNKDHRHKTKSGAGKCIQTQENRNLKMQRAIKRKKRSIIAINAVMNGASMTDLALQFDVSVTTISQDIRTVLWICKCSQETSPLWPKDWKGDYVQLAKKHPDQLRPMIEIVARHWSVDI